MAQCCICRHYIASLTCKHCDKTQDTMLSQMRHNEHSLPSQCMLPTANIVTPSTLSFDIQTPYLIRFPIVVWMDDRPHFGVSVAKVNESFWNGLLLQKGISWCLSTDRRFHRSLHPAFRVGTGPAIVTSVSGSSARQSKSAGHSVAVPSAARMTKTAWRGLIGAANP